MSILIIIASILLILVILIQNPKGGGLSSSFAGGAGNQIMGAKKTTDFLEKSTWALAIVLISLSLLTFVWTGDSNSGVKGKDLMNSPANPTNAE